MSNTYLNELVKQKTILANNITNKGVEATSDEKYNTLVDKVGDILELVGEVRILDVVTDTTIGEYKEILPTPSKNLFNKNKARQGYEITDAKTGTITSSASWFVTDYIPVKVDTTYVVSGTNRGSSVLWYDENKEFVTNSAYTNNKTFKSPTGFSNVAYVVLNTVLTDIDSFQVEEGTTATAYESYSPKTGITEIWQEI